MLRATGLTTVDGVGDEARLRVHTVAAEQWNRLNPTEQFFTLMEAAFLHANGGMIGESSRSLDSPFLTCLNAWRSLPKKGQRFDLSKPTYVYFMYWRFSRHTPFGDAALTLLNEQDIDVLMRDDEPPPFGAWQSLFQPYFPEWRENLVPPKPELREGVFVFKVSLGKMWRQIAIPDTLTLDDLANAVLEAVDFDDDHLYEFSFRDRLGQTTQIIHPYCEVGPSTDEFPIGELPLQPGQSMMFLFDYGDCWKFNVKLERIDPPNPRMKKPRPVARQGKAPKQYPVSGCGVVRPGSPGIAVLILEREVSPCRESPPPALA